MIRAFDHISGTSKVHCHKDISNKKVLLSLSDDKQNLNQILNKGIVNLKTIFSLLFLEHAYLAQYLSFRNAIFHSSQKPLQEKYV